MHAGTSVSATVNVTVADSVTYPDSNGQDNSFEWITNVSLGDINNSSGMDAGGYGDHTAQSTTLTIGESATLSVTINADSQDYVTAWFDWNHDGDFADSGETYVLATNTSSNGPHTVNVHPPPDAAIGDTVMRVAVKYQSAPGSDEVFQYGEVEDYTISIIANEVPIATGGSVTGTETTAYVFAWADFGISDTDTAFTNSTGISLETLPADGVIQYFEGAAWINASLNQQITKAQIDAGYMRFIPDANESGHDGYATPGTGDGKQDYAHFTYSPIHTTPITIANADGSADVLAKAHGSEQQPDG